MSAREELPDHPMVVAAVARLCLEGGWQRVLDGEVLTDPLDVADAELLTAAGVYARSADGGGFSLARTDGWLGAPAAALGHGATALLRRALRHAVGAVSPDEDRALLLDQGASSAVSGQLLVEQILPRLDGALDQLATGNARFLDVGAGVGGLAIRVCELLSSVQVTGLEVMPAAVRLAEHEIAEHGTTDRVEIRNLDVADLEDSEEYDVVWMSQPFIRPEALRDGLDRVREALARGGWLVMAINGRDPLEGELGDALARHSARLHGGEVLLADEARQLLEDKGYVDVEVLSAGPLTVATGRRGA